MKRIRMKWLTGIMAALCAVCLILGACSSSKVTLSFETNGGDPIEAVEVEKGETFTLPVPTRGEEYSFEGWYDNADLGGTAVTEVVAEDDATFYAKWEQLYEIKLDLGGGTLDAGRIYAKAGSGIYDAVKDLVPVRDGWQFDSWYLNGSRLTTASQMSAAAVELTAHYKVGYIVEIYEQNLTQNGYVKAAEDYVGYTELTSAPFTPVVTHKGFDLCAEQPADAVATKVLTETMSQNKFKLYFDRHEYRVTFLPNYPDGQTGDGVTRQMIYGLETPLPDDNFTADGYFLYGWHVMSGEEDYMLRSNYIDSLVINSDEEVKPATVIVDGEMTLTAVWSKAYTDMMRGVDQIYLFDETDTVCYLSRYGKYFKGEYVASNRSVLFYDEYDSIIMQGRLKNDGTFIYAVPERQEIVADYYAINQPINTSVQIYMDEYDGITLRNGSSSSTGTYTIDDDRNYHVMFTSGEFSGEERILRILTSTVNGATRTLFQFRDNTEAEWDPLARAMVNVQSGNGVLTYLQRNYYALDLDGYGNATMSVPSSSGSLTNSSYYYTRNDDRLTLLTSSGSVAAECRILNVMNKRCYVIYSAAMDVTFKGEGNSSLRLDGMHHAVYTPASGSAIEGEFTASTSVFGGSIIKMTVNSKRYVFLTETTTTGERDDAVTSYSFQVKPENYAEYSYTDGNKIYYAPLLVMDDETPGRASVYGYTAARQYLKVAEGDYVYTEKGESYALTVDGDSGIVFPEEVLASPLDLHNLKVIVFGLGEVTASTSTYDVSYWYSYEKTGEGGKTDNTKTYKGQLTIDGAKQEAELELVSGFAVLKLSDTDWRVGPYTTSSNGVTTVEIGLVEGTTRFYVELTDGEADAGNTFLQLNVDGPLGSARERNADGTANQNVTMEFDGKGNATLITAQTEGDPKRVEGTLTQEQKTDFNGTEYTVYTFTAKSSEIDAFRFVILTSSSGIVFTRETTGYSGEYTEKDGTTKLELDGFGFHARYTAADTSTSEGIYTVLTEGEQAIIRVLIGNQYYYFDIVENGKFEVRGSEYGDYLFVTNYSFDGYLLHLDGHNDAKLEEAGDAADKKVFTGSYTVENGVFSLHIEGQIDTAGFEADYVGTLGYMVMSSTTYNAFLVEYASARNVYVDKENWTVLTLDGYGNAVRYQDYGGGESGHYYIIADYPESTKKLLYYMNAAGTDACMYVCDTATAEMEMKLFTPQGYYTEDLDSLFFSEYGFMVFNTDTRYYYDIASNGEVTVYLRDFGNPAANDYGYLAYEIGEFEDTMNFASLGEGFGTDTYYKTSGYGITFERNAEDTVTVEKDEGGQESILKYPVTFSDGKYPLEDLTFLPGGSDSFSVTGTVSINGKNTRGTVIRETDKKTSLTETYFNLSVTDGSGLPHTIRFDLSLHYMGADHATYEITQMRMIDRYQSTMYVDMYVLMSLLLGTQMKDSYGTLTFVTEYKEDGTVDEANQYINSDFGASSALNGYKLDKAKYTYANGIYTIDLPARTAADGEEAAADDGVYRAHIALGYSQYYYMINRVYFIGYNILAYTRVETLTADDNGTQYTVTTERILGSETSGYSFGDYYSIKLETGADEKTEVKYDLRITLENKFYLVVNTYDEDDPETILSAKYYELVFTEEEGDVVDESTVKKLTAVTVKAMDADVYYTDSGTAYAEVVKGAGESGEDVIIAFYYGGGYMLAKTCTYDEATSTYTVTTPANKTYEIVIDKAAKKATITEKTTAATAEA